jgi:hypothetical protein
MSKTASAPAPAQLPASELIKRAQRGDEAAFVELRKLLDQEPELWLEFGDLGTMAETAWLTLIAGEQNKVFRVGMTHKVAAIRVELGSAEASPLERLLIDRVCLTWLALHYVELNRVQLMQRGGLDWQASEYYDRRLSMAQKRYLAAIRALATVRRLLAPRPSPVQVAHADQVNVATEGAQQVNMTPATNNAEPPLPQLPPVTLEPADFTAPQAGQLVREPAVVNHKRESECR